MCEMETGPKIEMVAIDQVQLNPKNPRLNDAAVGPVADSIRHFGFRQPIVANRRTRQIEAGNTRWRAAQVLGLARIPVIWVDDDESTATAFGIADNRTGELAQWDEPVLAELLQSLQSEGQLDATGYDENALGELVAALQAANPTPPPEEGEIPEPQEGPTRVQPGEVWQLGKHRLLVGDCTVEENWQRLMDGKLAHSISTDPPYGINYVGGRAAQEERISAHRRGVGDLEADAYWDEMSDDEYVGMVVGSMSLAHQFSDEKAPLYIWFASTKMRSLLRSIWEAGWQERTLIAWVKNNGAGALFAQYKHWYEPVYYCFKHGKAPRWHGPTNERTVWEHDKPTVNDLHPTMKPIALIERTIVNSTLPGQLVVDPFMGSGTCFIAAERTARVAYGFELDPRYCDVILARWENLTGKLAERVV